MSPTVATLLLKYVVTPLAKKAGKRLINRKGRRPSRRRVEKEAKGPMGDYLQKLLKGKGTYTLLGLGIAAVVLKNFMGVDVDAIVSDSPEAAEGIKYLWLLLLGAAGRRALKK